MKVGGLFSGIGGLELGFHREGFKTVWLVENNPFCQEVLKKNFPGVKIYGDITDTNFRELERADILVGGFPCQDISFSGKGAGIVKGTRSSLWKEFLRAIKEQRPLYAVIENVGALTRRGLGTVLYDLAKAGYDAEWHDIRASDVGAPHKRERIFIVAYTTGSRSRERTRGTPELVQKREGGLGLDERLKRFNEPETNAELAYAKSSGCKEPTPDDNPHRGVFYIDGCGENSGKTSKLSDSAGERLERGVNKTGQIAGQGSNAKGVRLQISGRNNPPASCGRWWETEPDMGRVAYGVSRGLDSFIWKEQIKALGNAVVPQVAQVVARIVKQKAVKE